MKSLRAYLAAAAIAIAGIAGSGAASAKPIGPVGTFLCKPVYYQTVRIHLWYTNKDLVLVYHVHGKCFRHLVKRYHIYHPHRLVAGR